MDKCGSSLTKHLPSHLTRYVIEESLTLSSNHETPSNLPGYYYLIFGFVFLHVCFSTFDPGALLRSQTGKCPPHRIPSASKTPEAVLYALFTAGYSLSTISHTQHNVHSCETRFRANDSCFPRWYIYWHCCNACTRIIKYLQDPDLATPLSV